MDNWTIVIENSFIIILDENGKKIGSTVYNKNNVIADEYGVGIVDGKLRLWTLRKSYYLFDFNENLPLLTNKTIQPSWCKVINNTTNKKIKEKID